MKHSKKILLSVMASTILFVGCGTQKSTRSSLDTLSHVAQKSSIDFNDGAIHLDNGQLLQLDATKEVFDVKDITLYTWKNQDGETISFSHKINMPLSYHDSLDVASNGLNKHTFTVTAENALCVSDTKTFTAYVHRDKIEGAVTTKQDTAQALLGPLSAADIRIEMLSDKEVDTYEEFLVYEGKTTSGDGHDVQSAGHIELPQSVKDSLSGENYVVSISKGTDIDIQDDLTWDSTATKNNGTIHAIVPKEALISGNYKVTILTEIAYKVAFYDDHIDAQYKLPLGANDRMKNIAKALIREDIDGDGDIDYHDILAWNPQTDKKKLVVNYDDYIKEDVESILQGKRYRRKLKIHEISAGEIKYEDGMTKHLYDWQELWYNNEGKMVRLIDNRGELYYESILSYHANGKLKKTVSDWGRGSGMHSINIYEYDQYENLVKQEYFGVGSMYYDYVYDTVTTWTYSYDENGNILSKEESKTSVKISVEESVRRFKEEMGLS